ncbi:MAG: tRNA (adenosine(37)-N6)-threonylcarbamoyltransferase complex transferase subunit TsaD [Flavobacteriales bacterium]|nr:tRNA (adenosine(37)-N6)-threonylcarbamoyltransferase complex transferase subunit TsaD [Flavobacteriales bacterium]
MPSKQTIILGIESSCDDTSAAIVKEGILFSNVIANQKVHQEYGGVVPELASRAHQQNIVPVVSKALTDAGVTASEISAIAYTQGPGLLGSLLVGSSFAKSMALALHVPLIEVNHMQAHILAHFTQLNETPFNPPSFPFLCLTVSGGHTQIVKVSHYQKMEILGQTIDDAAGEAFDKIAKIIGLNYPGGPLIDLHAKEGNPKTFKFPHPSVPDLNFSFSGLKTSVLYFLKKEIAKNPDFIALHLNDICASVQQTIVDILIEKLALASQRTRITQIALAGGVSANTGLQKKIREIGKEKNWKVFIPEFQLCTDNAGMIATAGYFKFLEMQFSDMHSTPLARLKF